MSDNIGELLVRAKNDNTNSDPDQLYFAKLLTAIERAGRRSLNVPELLEPTRQAFRIGITGPPGAGKSTLIGRLLDQFKHLDLKIGVLAVDPTSPITSGAVLGDRIRYSDHALNSRVFIRSIGTRGNLGGLAAQTYLHVRAFDACGFDIVLIETVGVGQVEVEVMNIADAIVLVLVPESGDSIQVMKAGIIEIADVLVVNKSDRPGADGLKRELESQVSTPVLTTSASNNEGVDKLVEAVETFRRNREIWAKKRLLPRRLRAEAIALKRDEIETHSRRLSDQIETSEDLKNFVNSAT